MDHDIEARLTRAGLTGEEIRAEFERFDSLDTDGQRAYRSWLQQVSDTDIAAAVRDDAGRAAPVITHETAAPAGDAPAPAEAPAPAAPTKSKGSK